MRIEINGVEIPVARANIILARNAVNTFVEVSKNGAEKSGNISLYLTTLIMMYKKSEELLNELGVDNLQYILQTYGQDAGEGNHEE